MAEAQIASPVIRSEHFERLASPEAQRALFKASVEQIEIETHTYCNRVCWFCPNSKIDRRSTNHRMNEALYLRILAELAEIDYDKIITYSRYNEPLADRGILNRIRQARIALPSATLLTHTNGDYLTADYLDELCDAGLNQMRVQVYLGNEDRFDDQKMRKRMDRRLAELGLPFDIVDVQPGLRYEAHVSFPGMAVSFEAHNFEAMGLDRGQTVEGVPGFIRLAPCLIPFRHLYIDWNGAVVPCCNIRSDEPSHAAYVVDRLAEGRTIFQAFAESALVEWRRSLVKAGPHKAPCSTCAYALPSEAEIEETAHALPVEC